MALNLKDLLHIVIRPEKNWRTHLLCQWREIIGSLHDKVCIEKIYDDTIVLGVFHSSWMQELYLLSPLLIKKINEKLDQPYVKHIRFKQIGTKKQSLNKKTAIKSIKKDIPLTKKDELLLAKISDPELRSALKAFRIRCYLES